MILLSFIISLVLALVLYPADDHHEWKFFLLVGTFFTPISGLLYWWMTKD